MTTFAGQALAGNVTALTPGMLDNPGWTETNLSPARRSRGTPTIPSIMRWCACFSFPAVSACWSDAISRSASGSIASCWRPGRWSIAIVIVLGLAGGLFVTRRVLRRVEAMTETTRTIMNGDLSGRLPVAGTGDELDRLAENLNIMLERIEALMAGLKEVSDNIAHDLKTPLTRLRNRAEQALRTAKSDAEYRAALEATIDESDGLIRTFNALLMIARAESGQARDDMTDFDAAEIARDVGELYEPLAEEKGIALKVEADAAAPVKGNRELVSQALANLVDNAIKYAEPDAEAGEWRGAGNRRARFERRRPYSVDGGRPGTGHPGKRPRARGRALRAAGAEPLATGLRAGLKSCLGGGAPARRRTDA